MSEIAPKFCFQPIAAPLESLHGSPARIIEFDGRAGLNFTGVRGRLAVPEHTLNSPQGALTLWVATLDDIDCAPPQAHHAKSNPRFDKIPFLSDREALHEVDVAHFALYYWTWWHPGFIAKWGRGSYLECSYSLQQKPTAATGHFHFEARTWYQLALTWDRPAGIYKLYANGVLIASHDTTATRLWDQPCGPVLHLGNPLLALSDLDFYTQTLDPEAVRRIHAAQATHAYPDLAAELAYIYEGAGLAPLDWQPDDAWTESLHLSLCEPAHYQEFFLQGCNTAVSFTPEGFRIRTPDFEESATLGGVGSVNKYDTSIDLSRLYLWTHRRFEGDIHVSFDFKLNAHGGLALLMSQASGMQREDFLEDYALRVNGSMSTVFGEDVRSYHWEFYREMCDTRNDLVSHGLIKNPWYRPLGFQMEPRRWELQRWYHLDWVQEGNRLRAAIDGLAVLDVQDSSRDNNGPIFTGGRLALRCMMRTDLVVRDFRVANRPRFRVRGVGQTC